MKKPIIIASALMLSAVSGCLDSNFEESDVVLQAKDCVEVASENPDWTVVSASLDVKSNRSWSAVITSDNSSWLTIETPSRSNVGKTTEVSSLELSFDNWDNPSQDRTATLHISTEGKAADVQIVQKALVPRLELASPEEYSGIDAGGDVIYVRIRTNWYWNASFTEDTDAGVSADVTSGYKDGMITVTVGPNVDDSPKSAFLRIRSEAEGVGYLTVIIRQNPQIPEE